MQRRAWHIWSNTALELPGRRS